MSAGGQALFNFYCIVSEDIERKIEMCLIGQAKSYSQIYAENHNRVMTALTELKQGLGLRVEQHGEKIAVLQEQISNSVKQSDFLPVKDVVIDLQSSKKWVVTAIVGAFLTQLTSFLKRG